MMNLTVNGDLFEHSGPPSLPSLLTALDAQPDQVAVMLNNDIITKDNYSTVRLSENDTLEIMMLVGGGSAS